MNIQPADRLRLLGSMLQLQNDRVMQNVAVCLHLACHREVGIVVRVGLETESWRGHCLVSMKF